VTSDAAPFIRLEDVSRSFGATRAVRNVTMDLATPGQIHALVGENGAGKSTCLGMAAGRVPQSSGSITVSGQELPPGSPRASKALGVHAIYQELTIVPALSPQANVFLGNTLASAGWLNESEMRRRYEELCTQLSVTPQRGRSGDLSVADQQILEIMRALVSDAKAVLFDEPTASLAHAERESLFRTMHQLRDEGLALVLVSHNLDEVLQHSDVITVMRDGQLVERRPAARWTKGDMVKAMLGDHAHGTEIASGQHGRVSRRVGTNRTVMSVRGLTSPGIIEDISFELREGEILGIAGLVGAGRTSVLRVLAGLDPAATGEIEVGGSTRVPRSVPEARRRGIALLPEDRKGQGLLLARNGADNITLGEWKDLSRWSLLSSRAVNRAAAVSAKAVGFNVGRLDSLVGQLSGGNQQKLMIARWLHAPFPVLLADEPTRGVDVGAKAEILVALEDFVRNGHSIIVVSSELEEVVGLADRVLVMDKGRSLGMFDTADGEITVARVLETIFGATIDDAKVGS
jgi:rhamnose transport system ATP-binding protein